LPEKAKKRFYLGIYQDDTADALWTQSIIEETRITPDKLPPLIRIVVAIDPSGAESDLDEKRDAIGIVVAALGNDGHGYILNDATMHGSPEQWGSKAVAQYRFYKANAVVGEINYGGAMVEYVIRSIDPSVRFIPVTASRGKVVRAQPISALYGGKKVHHVGYFPEMEEEMCSFTDFGYVGEKSPNRADALVWALTELMLEESEAGWVQYYQSKLGKGPQAEQVAKINEPTFHGPVIPPPATHCNLKTKPHAAFYASGTDGTSKRITADEHGVIYAEVVYMSSLLAAGCERA